MNKDLHFSSKKDSWLTPKYIFNYFDRAYSFDLDPCATAENALCKRYFTIEQDGLLQSWTDCKVFLNPPYGRDIYKWVRKSYFESQNNNATVVCLLPARTDTRWFWNYCRYGLIHFLQGRVKFSNHHNCAPFPSMIVVFDKGITSTGNGKIFDVEHNLIKSDHD